ncbi:manganese efflux pump MntP [Desulforhopalus singaporensis]|uniref:Putative manganese efflux pump MntP n=1 Tax=Desulforhopalus singaporensis TaxID=91360 RepID=A0A1H0U3I4_9BACT|nr:manganese efflux pump MntP family protein [Desulforhopalus singaporensis]SDP60620.1 Putative Mn2+ efflux pump MntP [Desulforhopalus singaporensis]
MDFFTLVGIAVALAMDAFAVALGAGTLLNPVTGRQLFRLGFHFGLFQGIMPVIGWLAGIGLKKFVTVYAPWIAFSLLILIGGKMIYEALTDLAEDGERRDPTRGFTMVLLSVATSIDALAVGFSLSMLGVDIWTPALVIGVITASLTVIGMLTGRKIGSMWGERVEVAGGLVLITIGVKILLQSL